MGYLIVILLVATFWGLVTYALGKSKGINGFWYGFCLGLIGFIIVACMKSREEAVEAKVIVNNVASSEDKYKTLERLYELKTNGVITDEEFILEKQKIMSEE